MIKRSESQLRTTSSSEHHSLVGVFLGKFYYVAMTHTMSWLKTLLELSLTPRIWNLAEQSSTYSEDKMVG